MENLELTPSGVNNIDVFFRIKHKDCVDRVVAELADGREMPAPINRPEGLKAYRIEYSPKSMYHGRVERIPAEDLLE